MKVALLGAPGSGKTKLARKLSHGLNEQSDRVGSWKVIDGYVDRLSRRTGSPYGAIFDHSAYRANLQVVAERWTLEDEAQHKGYNTLTCGSIFETMIYAAAQSVPIADITNENLMLFESHIAENMMSALGLLGGLVFDYDCLLYLPLTGGAEHGWPLVVDAKLDEVLTGQNKEAIILDGTSQQRIQKATSAIKALQETRESLERGIRRDPEPGEGKGDQPGQVSNLSAEEDRDSTRRVDVE